MSEPCTRCHGSGIEPGTEPGYDDTAILSRKPKLYLKFDLNERGLEDSAGAGYAGAIRINGTPTEYHVSTAHGEGIRLGEAWVEADHDAVFTTPGAEKSNTIVESEATFSCHCAFPSVLQHDMVLFCKTEVDELAPGFSLRVRKEGAIELRVRDYKHKPLVRMLTLPDTILAGSEHHFTVTLGHRGAWFTVDGRQAEDGFRNTLAWWGLDHRHNGVEEGGRAESARVTNTSSIMIGREPGQERGCDIVVSQFAVFYSGAARESFGQLTESLGLQDMQEIAGASGDPLPNPRFSKNAQSPTAGLNTIQAAIDDCTPNGTVVLSGDYTQNKNLILKRGVRITSRDGAVVSFTNDSVLTSAKPSAIPALAGGGDLVTGAASYKVQNALSDNAVFLVVDKTPLEELYRVTEIHNPLVRKSDLIPIRSRTDDEIVFGRAPYFSYKANNRLATVGFEPTPDIQIDGKITFRKNGGTGPNILGLFNALRRARFSGIAIEQTSTTVPYLLGAMFCGCVEVSLTGCRITTVSPQGTDGTKHPYACKFAGCANYDVFDHTGHSNDWHAMDSECDNLDDEWGMPNSVPQAHWGGQFGDIRRSRFSTKNNNFPCICHTSNHIRMQDLDFISGGGISIDGYAHNIEAIVARPGGRNTQISHTRGIGAARIWHCDFKNKLGNWGNGKGGMRQCDYGDLHYQSPVQTSTFAPVPADDSNRFWNVDRAVRGLPV